MASVATQAKSQNPGHDNCAPVKFTPQQTFVTVNGSPVLLVGDVSSTHSCGDPYNHAPHTSTIAAGSSIVFINGIPAAREGDAISGCPVPVSVDGGDALMDIAQ